MVLWGLHIAQELHVLDFEIICKRKDESDNSLAFSLPVTYKGEKTTYSWPLH